MAVTKFLDTRTGKTYQKTDKVTLRTLFKGEPQHQLLLSERGVVFFDGHRNPNTQVTLTARLVKGIDEVIDFTGITFKWLNSVGLDVMDNELYRIDI